MNYPNYDKDLYEIYKSEVTGEALFATAARLTFSKRKKHIWLTLAKLETQTKNRYLDFVSSLGQAPRYPYSAKILGHLFGVLFALLPWSMAMKMLLAGTPPLIAVFERLEEHAPQQHKNFFTYVHQHEQAIKLFSEQELAGDDNSLSAITELL